MPCDAVPILQARFSTVLTSLRSVPLLLPAPQCYNAAVPIGLGQRFMLAVQHHIRIRTVTALMMRAKQVYQSDGFVPLLRRAPASAMGLLFFRRSYLIYVDPLEELQPPSEADLMPRVGDHHSRAVSSNHEADVLEAQGFEFRSQVPNARERLDKGAIALCTFVGRELACIEWVALTQQACDAMGQPPYSADFSKKEAWSGGLWTAPKYRRKGLRRYSSFKTFEFLLSRGITTTRTAIGRDNVAAHASRPHFLPGPVAEARYLRILWWTSWKEKPLTGGRMCTG